MDISKLFVRYLQRELVQRNLNDKGVKDILKARLQAAIDGNVSSSEMTTEQKAIAEKAIEDKAVADQAMADKERIEQEIRDTSAKDATEQEYPGNIDTRERIRAPVRPKVREVIKLVSPLLTYSSSY
jgi:hypothetical protein